MLAGDVGGDPAHPPVLLLHGGGQTRHSWRGAARTLVARGYHVICLDARGHGDSDWAPDGAYDWDGYVGDLRAVVGSLGTPPALVGASLGGMTALALSGDGSRSLATALVLVDIVAQLEDGVDRVLDFMAARPHGFASPEEAAEAVAAYNPHRPRPKVASGLMKNLRQRTDGRYYWHWDPKVIAARDHIDWDALERRMLTAAANVTVPTLLVRGLMSDVVSDKGIEQLRAHMTKLEVRDVAGAGHMVAGDKNDAFNAAVVEFLAKHHPPAKRP
jgi:pimeloyl-ACP methyl ester carboxylesterase